MRVLRDNRDSVMAMLEAFVYDPLLSWRLLARKNEVDESIPSNTSGVPAASASVDDVASSNPDESVHAMDDSEVETKVHDGDVNDNMPIAQSMIDRRSSARNEMDEEPNSENLNSR